MTGHPHPPRAAPVSASAQPLPGRPPPLTGRPGRHVDLGAARCLLGGARGACAAGRARSGHGREGRSGAGAGGRVPPVVREEASRCAPKDKNKNKIKKKRLFYTSNLVTPGNLRWLRLSAALRAPFRQPLPAAGAVLSEISVSVQPKSI